MPSLSLLWNSPLLSKAKKICEICLNHNKQIEKNLNIHPNFVVKKMIGLKPFNLNGIHFPYWNQINHF